MRFPLRLTGLIAAPHTPMNADGSLNPTIISAQAQLLQESGVSGAFICGTTGESLSLSVSERMAVMEAWEQAARGKLKRPSEWIIGALRAAGMTPPDIGPVMQAQNLLGEPLWRPSAPKGFADESGPWLDGLSQRLDIANQLARRMPAESDPRQIFEETIGPIASSVFNTIRSRVPCKISDLSSTRQPPVGCIKESSRTHVGYQEEE